MTMVGLSVREDKSVGYWNPLLAVGEAHRHAYMDLVNSSDRRKSKAAFLSLLRSDVDSVVGVALDSYIEAEMLERHGIENPFDDYLDDILGQCRRILLEPPVRTSQDRSALTAGANHKSAIRAMMHLAEADDSELLKHLLETSTDSTVRLGAIMAAPSVFDEEVALDLGFVTVLGKVLLGKGNPYEERSAALESLRCALSTDARSIIVEALSLDDIAIQAQAMLILLEEDAEAHQGMIQRQADEWPSQLPYQAREVRRILDRDYE